MIDAIARLIFIIAIPAAAVVIWKEWGEWGTIALVIVALALSAPLGQNLTLPLVSFTMNLSTRSRNALLLATLAGLILTIGGFIRNVASGWLISRAIEAF